MHFSCFFLLLVILWIDVAPHSSVALENNQLVIDMQELVDGKARTNSMPPPKNINYADFLNAGNGETEEGESMTAENLLISGLCQALQYAWSGQVWSEQAFAFIAVYNDQPECTNDDVQTIMSNIESAVLEYNEQLQGLTSARFEYYSSVINAVANLTARAPGAMDILGKRLGRIVVPFMFRRRPGASYLCAAAKLWVKLGASPLECTLELTFEQESSLESNERFKETFESWRGAFQCETAEQLHNETERLAQEAMTAAVAYEKVRVEFGTAVEWRERLQQKWADLLSKVRAAQEAKKKQEESEEERKRQSFLECEHKRVVKYEGMEQYLLQEGRVWAAVQAQTRDQHQCVAQAQAQAQEHEQEKMRLLGEQQRQRKANERHASAIAAWCDAAGDQPTTSRLD